MRKNQKNVVGKVDKSTQKTDSEKKGIGEARQHDLDSEKTASQSGYPPELAQFLGELIINLSDQIMQRSESQHGSDEEAQYESDEDAQYESDEELSDDMLANVDFSKLELDENGKRVLFESALNCPDKYEGVLTEYYEVMNDEEAIRNKVVIKVHMPYLRICELDKLEQSDVVSQCMITNGKDAAFIHPDTANELSELLRKIGYPMGREEVEPGEDIRQAVSSLSEEKGKNPLRGSAAREDGYYEDLMEYWYGGDIYHEKDVLWLSIEKRLDKDGGFIATTADLDAYGKLFEPCDITSAKGIEVKNYRRVLSAEEKREIKKRGQKLSFFTELLPHQEVWYLATKHAELENTPGFCLVCLHGKFMVPVERRVNPITFECEDHMVVFNGINCLPQHHAFAGVVSIDVGNMPIRTPIRYCKGHVYSWEKRIQQELDHYHFIDANYNPYDDPLDDTDIDDD